MEFVELPSAASKRFVAPRWINFLVLVCFSRFLALLCEEPYWPSVNIMNHSPIPLNLYWMASDTQQKLIGKLLPNYQSSQDTFVGHRFRLEPADHASENFGSVDVLIEGAGAVSISIGSSNLRASKLQASWLSLNRTKPQDPVYSEDNKEFGREKAKECVRNLEVTEESGSDPHASTEDADVFCRAYPLREFVLSKVRLTPEHWQQKMAGPWGNLHEQVVEQPPSLSNFTSRGFVHLRRKSMPPHDQYFDEEFQTVLHDTIEWYENNRLHAQPENHGIYDPSVSSYESDTWIVHPPRELSKPLAEGIQKALESWAGLAPGSLRYSSFYGPRLYRNGSVLRQHVDMWETHVLSAIIAVGRRGLHNPWPLQILDHDGQKHIVNDEPGDVILYESATCAHDRERVLRGREVANIFVHFRPKEGWAPLEGSHLVSNADKVVQSAEL